MLESREGKVSAYGVRVTRPAAPYGLAVVEGCADCTSRQEDQLRNLAKETIRDFQAFRQTALYPSKALLYIEGEKPRGLFVVCTGKARVIATSKEGRRITLRVVELGETIGLST